MQVFSKLSQHLASCSSSSLAAYSVTALAALLAYGYWPYLYWWRRGIRQPPMLPWLGNLLALMRVGFRDLLLEYPRLYGRVYGTYLSGKPVLVVGDPDMLKQICIKKAEYFTNRNRLGSEAKPFDRGITVLQDQEWKHVRNILTPSFSTGKIKAMFAMVDRSSQQLCASLLKANGEPVDVKSYFMNFTIDAVASTLFGLQINSQEDADNAFKYHTNRIFNVSFRSWKIVLLFLFPGIIAPLFKKLRVSLFPQESIDFFQTVIRDAMREREAAAQPGQYNDFLESMVAARQEAERNGAKGLTEDEVMAQSLTFFLAGFETTANALQFAVYFMAQHQDCQQKAYEEAAAAAQRNGGKVTYDCLRELQYLNQCIDESLRLCPPALLADRVCKETTVVNGYEIEKGVVIHIPIFSLARDPELWQDPDRFDPERFNPEMSSARDATHLIPFGLGPRNCIGMRLAQMELRKALAEMLLQLKWMPHSLTPRFEEMKFKPNGLLSPKEPIMLRAVPRQG